MPLSRLPLGTVFRSLLILSLSSSPILLKPCIQVLSALTNPKSPFLDVARNPVLFWLVKSTLYKQFNAGENKHEVQRSIKAIKELGYRGVFLGYAREVLPGQSAISPHAEEGAIPEVEAWLKGTLQTVEMASEGDFVALKLTGMGEHALHLLQQRLPPAGFMDAAIREVCDAAIVKGVNLIVDAEEQVVQPGIEAWTLRYQKYCSCRRLPHRTTLYGTYQAYLRSLPSTLAKHIEISQCEGYTLGVKLVRGAYMNTEPRHLIWATKQETDRCYDDIVDALLTRQCNATLRPISNHSGKEIPPVKLVIATHNQESTRKAHNIRSQQATRNQPRIELAYAQLQGMADEVSYRLIHGFQDRALSEDLVPLEKPNVYKLLVWGSIKECMGFLLRRAVENSEAVARTKQSQIAMATELKRRIRKSLGFPV